MPTLNVLVVLCGLAPGEVPLQRPSGAITEPPQPEPTPPAEVQGPIATDEAAADGSTPDGSTIDGSTADAATAQPPATESVAASPAAEPVVAMPIAVDGESDGATVIDLDRYDRPLRRANTMLSAGGVVAAIGGLMLIGAVTEAGKAPCKFDLDSCPNAPRPSVTRGLAVGAAIGLIGGGALVAAGLVKRRKVRARIEADAKQVGLAFVGRF